MNLKISRKPNRMYIEDNIVYFTDCDGRTINPSGLDLYDQSSIQRTLGAIEVANEARKIGEGDFKRWSNAINRSLSEIIKSAKPQE